MFWHCVHFQSIHKISGILYTFINHKIATVSTNIFTTRTMTMPLATPVLPVKPTLQLIRYAKPVRVSQIKHTVLLKPIQNCFWFQEIDHT